MKSVPEKVTPKKAQEWLKRNECNRPLKPRAIDRYTQAMLRGAWQLNGENIKFNCNGRLIDGQNRLNAIIKSGCTIETYVVRGLPDCAFDTIDQGVTRSLADVLHRNGEKNCAVLASAIRWLVILRDREKYKVLSMPIDESMDELVKNPELRESVAKFVSKAARTIIPGGVGAACRYLCIRPQIKNGNAQGMVKAEMFFERLITGEGLSRYQPVFHLREAMIRNFKETAKLPHDVIAAMTVKAWNATLADKQMRSAKPLEWDREENFPEIKQ